MIDKLVEEYQSGSKEALDGIIASCSDIVRNASRRYFLIGAETEDAYQEGFLGLIKAANTYTAEKGTFRCYAYVCVNNAMMTAVRKYAGNKNKVLNDGLPLSEAVDIPYSGGENPEDLFIEDETRREFIDGIGKQLSVMEKEILSLFLTGLSYDEITKKTGKSHKTVDNALQRIRKKLRRI